MVAKLVMNSAVNLVRSMVVPMAETSDLLMEKWMVGKKAVMKADLMATQWAALSVNNLAV